MSRNHRAAKWNGAASRAARARLQPAVDAGMASCARCGRPIMPGQPWDAGHRVDLGDDLSGQHGTAAEHRSCNRGAGGRRGAAITNARRAAANNMRAW